MLYSTLNDGVIRPSRIRAKSFEVKGLRVTQVPVGYLDGVQQVPWLVIHDGACLESIGERPDSGHTKGTGILGVC